jgi:hypothetical protein
MALPHSSSLLAILLIPQILKRGVLMRSCQGKEAAKAFIGENLEIMNNSLYQDQRNDFHE